MGSIVSALVGGGDAAGNAYSEPSESLGVQKFHSPARWQLHFNELKQSPQLMVIDFAATWCGPCKMMEPFLNSMASKFTSVSFANIDVDELSEVAQEFGVQAMPTFVLVKQGKEVARVVGAKKEELEKKIQMNSSS